MSVTPSEDDIFSDSDKNEIKHVEEKNSDKNDNNVVSEINTFLVSALDVKPFLKPTNRMAKLLFSVLPKHNIEDSNRKAAGEPQIQKKNERAGAGAGILKIDKEGDLVLSRRGNHNIDDDLSLFIEYENSTSLDQVGLQVWRGALLLADFIIHWAQKNFQNKTILEFGSGTGLSSIVASMYGKKVIATDLDSNDSSILRLIETNVKHNMKHVRSEFLVKALDFKNLSWSTDLEECIMEAEVLLAADVVYHEKITEAFVKTLQKCLWTGKPKNVFIAIEKRYVFTISDLDVVAPMYEAFLEQLQSVLGLSLHSFSSPETGLVSSLTSSMTEKTSLDIKADTIAAGTTTTTTTTEISSSHRRLSIRPIHIDFPQYFNYERNNELVLWHIQSEICS